MDGWMDGWLVGWAWVCVCVAIYIANEAMLTPPMNSRRCVSGGGVEGCTCTCTCGGLVVPAACVPVWVEARRS